MKRRSPRKRRSRVQRLLAGEYVRSQASGQNVVEIEEPGFSAVRKTNLVAPGAWHGLVPDNADARRRHQNCSITRLKAWCSRFLILDPMLWPAGALTVLRDQAASGGRGGIDPGRSHTACRQRHVAPTIGWRYAVFHCDDPKVILSARTMMAATMLEIVANTRSGRAQRAVTPSMISRIRRICSPAVRPEAT